MATYKVKAYGEEYTVEVIEQAAGARVLVEGYSFEVETAAPGSVPGRVPASRAVPTTMTAPPPVVLASSPSPVSKAKPVATPAGGRGAVAAPIPGVITKVCVTVGEAVRAGHTVVKLEAMKMENDITALMDGAVKEVAVTEGEEVSDGQLLVLVG